MGIGFIVVVTLVATAGFLYGLFLGWRAITLQSAGQSIQAEVTGFKPATRKRGCRVQYRFSVGTPEVWYTHDCPLDGRNAFVTIDKKTWTLAKDTGRVEVLYWPRNPSVNLAVGAASAEWFIGAALFIPVYGFMASVGWFAIVGGVRQFVRRRAEARRFAQPQARID